MASPKILIRVIIVVAAIVIAAATASSQSRVQELQVSVGLPKGPMDYSLNATYRLIVSAERSVHFVLMAQESCYPMKSKGGVVVLNDLSAYALLRWRIVGGERTSASVLAGPGGHFLWSRDYSGRVGSQPEKSRVVAKAHGYLEARYAVTERQAVTVSTRITQSDWDEVEFDQVYFGYGIRL